MIKCLIKVHIIKLWMFRLPYSVPLQMIKCLLKVVVPYAMHQFVFSRHNIVCTLTKDTNDTLRVVLALQTYSQNSNISQINYLFFHILDITVRDFTCYMNSKNKFSMGYLNIKFLWIVNHVWFTYFQAWF